MPTPYEKEMELRNFFLKLKLDFGSEDNGPEDVFEVTEDPGGVGHYGPREAGPSGAGPYGPGGAGLSVPGGAGPYGPGEPGGAGPGTGSTGGEGLVRVDLEVSVGGTPGGGPDGSGPDVKKTSVIYLNLY
ncbi:hypothetical protein AVEN_31803-1 [Araneus ventricosus]|uniref:Uncharacterized protein n=1 Tax=Araneus ventricosus TaxID=182803 RepID=A0A4Y2VV87_ARAVE|nr:hypothetical protein AVEN_31803-1 [Araneus ventricosus]